MVNRDDDLSFGSLPLFVTLVLCLFHRNGIEEKVYVLEMKLSILAFHLFLFGLEHIICTINAIIKQRLNSQSQSSFIYIVFSKIGE